MRLQDGSYSVLLANVLDQEGALAGIVEPEEFSMAPRADVIILSYDDPALAELPFAPGTTIVDPWRSFSKRNARTDLHVVNYGNTRV